MSNSTIEQNIKAKFVHSLMEYFKIEEDINLRGHIADLVRNIDKSQYREFLRRLSSGNMTYKTAFEKIAIVANSFDEEFKNILFSDVKRRVKQLYDVMYELRRQIVNEESSTEEIQRFTNVYFSKIKDKHTDIVIFDELDIEVIKALGKEWIYSTIIFDKSLFMETVESKYKSIILMKETALNNKSLENKMTKQIDNRKF